MRVQEEQMSAARDQHAAEKAELEGSVAAEQRRAAEAQRQVRADAAAASAATRGAAQRVAELEMELQRQRLAVREHQAGATASGPAGALGSGRCMVERSAGGATCGGSGLVETVPAEDRAMRERSGGMGGAAVRSDEVCLWCSHNVKPHATHVLL